MAYSDWIVKYDEAALGNFYHALYGNNIIKWCGAYDTAPVEKEIPVKLTPMIKRLLDSDSQTLYKAGYLNGDLELTEAGRNALQTIIFTQNKAELVKLAQEVLEEAKDKK